jgi:hypothetical protein
MTRYFEKFYNSDPMVEISAADARARGTYTVEDDLPMRRFRRFIDHELHTIIYAGGRSNRASLGLPPPRERRLRTDLLARHPAPAWRVQLDLLVRESRRRTLVAYTIYHYDRDGHLLELVTHAPDGTVLNTQDA